MPFVSMAKCPHTRVIDNVMRRSSVVYYFLDMLMTGFLAVCPHASLCTSEYPPPPHLY